MWPFFHLPYPGQVGVIGQKVLVKTATTVETSIAVAVISFLKEDTGWTKSVGRNLCKH